MKAPPRTADGARTSTPQRQVPSDLRPEGTFLAVPLAGPLFWRARAVLLARRYSPAISLS
jgi:hypothetical protein